MIFIFSCSNNQILNEKIEKIEERKEEKIEERKEEKIEIVEEEKEVPIKNENIVNIIEVNNVKNEYNIMSKFKDEKLPYNIKNKDNHSKAVIIAFLDKDNDFKIDNDESIRKSKNINLLSFSNTNKRQLSGIINMSYAYYRNIENMNLLNKNSEYINNKGIELKKPFKEFITNKYFDDTYNQNITLKVAALGNLNRSRVKNAENFSSSLLESYQKMKPELQELFRSETILAKNQIDDDVLKKWNKYLKDLNSEEVKLDFVSYEDENGNKYYEYKKNKCSKNQTQPYLLRSFTVGANAFVIDDNNDLQVGSSISAPRVSRLAYELKEKFPFLSYQQIKQIILTTAKHPKDGYLSDSSGWGMIDYEKAMKGPSDFNAGLIDEMKFFDNNFNKIYSFDETGNVKDRFFYVNIPENEEYEFSNDITSGLKGDGNSKEETVIKMIGSDYPNGVEKVYRYKIAKVLDSEKNYYSNVAQAGLRKDGLGKLILSGEQNYNSKTEVLNGVLELKNNSKSDYYISKLAIFNINSNKKVELKNIYLNGKINIDSDLKIKNLTASKDSSITIKNTVNIESEKFKTAGKIYINFNEVKFNGKILSKEKPEITDENIENIYIKTKIEKQNSNYVINYENKYKKLSDLTEEELRNIPSYSINEKKFFEEYNGESVVNNGIINLKATELLSEEDVKKQLFTDNYASFITTLFSNFTIKENNKDNILKDNSNRIFVNTYFNFNLKEDKYNKFDKFSQKIWIYNLGFSKKILQNNIVGLFFNYNNEMLKFKNSDFINNSYGLNFQIKHIFKDIEISNFNSLTINNTKIRRNLFDEGLKDIVVENSIKSYLFENETKLKLGFKNVSVSPFLLLQYLKVNKTEKEKSKYGIFLNDNNIFKSKIGLNLELENSLNNNISILNKLKYSYLLSKNNVDVSANVLNVNVNLMGKKLEKNDLNYTFLIKYSKNRINLSSYLNLDLKMKLGLGFLVEYVK